MTNAAPEPLIPDGYALMRLMATNRPAAIRAIHRACDRRIDEFNLKLETMEKAMGVRRQPDPEKRLAAYLLKPDEMWAGQRMYFPDDYKKDWDDFQKLRQRAADGAFAGAADEAGRIVREASRPMTPPPQQVY